MRSFILVCLIYVFSGSGYAEETGDTVQDAEQQAMSVEDILQREPQREDYGEEPRCISTHRIRSLNVLDEKHVSFRMSGKQYYLVQFAHRCPGLQRGKPVMYEPGNGNRLCQLDGIRPLYQTGIGNYTPGMRCAIPGFQKITKEQLVALKDALKIERRKKKKDA